MRACKLLMAVAALIALSVTTAWADWDEGDSHKMTVPQLPDPQGLDVNFRQPKVLADDWVCSDSGPVSDVHFWFSLRNDGRDINGGQPITDPAQLASLMGPIHVSIHDDDRTGPYSKPGGLLWQNDFLPLEYTIRPYGSGPQGWYDPNPPPVYIPAPDHFGIWQVNIENIPDPWIQDQGTIYWLDLSVISQLDVGWKTSLDTWGPLDDDAVWGDFPTPEWQELHYPSPGPHQGESINLAFVITPEPAALGLLLLSLPMALRRR